MLSRFCAQRHSVCACAARTDTIIAWTSGWIWPLVNIMHCESLQVFTHHMRGTEGARVRGGALGLGLLVGAATFAFGWRKGCRKAEILAINDDGAICVCEGAQSGAVVPAECTCTKQKSY